MRIFIIWLLFEVLMVIPSFGQVGDLFLSHHRPDGEGIDNLNFDLTVNAGGLLHIANRSGVLIYDGKTWDFHLTPSAALSIAVADNGDIYVGCVDDYGKIVLVGDSYQFVSLAKNNTSHLVFETIIHDNKVYFIGERTIAIIDLLSNKSKTLNLPEDSHIILNAYDFEDGIHIQTDKDVYVINEDAKMVSSYLLSPDSTTISFVVKHPNQDKYLIASEDENAYIYNNGDYKKLSSTDHLKNNNMIMMDGDWVTDDLFVLSTLEHGCMLFSLSEDRLIDVIDDGSGLPDNQVFDMVTDEAEGLWIAHEFGVSRLAPVLPVRSFSNYPGLHGNLLAVSEYQDKMYFATSKGVYHLESFQEYKNIVYYTIDTSTEEKVEKNQSSSTRTALNMDSAQPKEEKQPQNNKNAALDLHEDDSEEEGKKKKKLFSKLSRLKDKVFKRKKNDQDEKETEALADNQNAPTQPDRTEEEDANDQAPAEETEPEEGSETEIIANTEAETPDSTSQPTESEKEKKGFFSFLKKAADEVLDSKEIVTLENGDTLRSKRRKHGLFSKLRIAFGADKSSNDANLDIINPEGVFVGRPEKNIKYKRNVKRELVSTNYEFQPIPGMQTKCKQFITFEGQLLAVCTSGIYLIGDDDAELVIDVPARNMIVSNSGDQLIINTINDQLMVFEHIDDIWAQVDEIDLLGDIILSLHQDKSGQTWAASPTSLYVIDASYRKMLKSYSIPNQYIDNIKINEIDSKIYLINNQGYFYVDEAMGKVVEDTVLHNIIGDPIKHLQQPNGETWVYNGKIWHLIDHNGEIHEKEHLALFPDMTFIHEIDDSYWVINETHDVYQVDKVISDSLVFNSKMSIREVRGTHGHIELTDDLVFNYDENYVTFELARPDYLGLLQVEYQYKMEGLNDQWSTWSSNNIISFNFLPPGSYKLLVRSRDSFGRFLENSPIYFKVKPPYWKTVWFALVELCFFVIMFTFSIWLNRRKHQKYRLLTQILTIFTIVLVIEFLQSLAQNTLSIESTPVVDFLINAIIAFVIFPLEHFLRLFMREGTAAIPFFPGDHFWRKLGVIPKSQSRTP